MAVKSNIKGLILEEVVLYLLIQMGYRMVLPSETGVETSGVGGLLVHGRGEKHQIDALVAYDHTPAFIYPVRLMVEAKCYTDKVGIGVVRNAVGVLKDVSENYFTSRRGATEIQIPRFNYHGAIFSSSGYSANAQRYAIAHQIFLIQYKNVDILAPIIKAINALEDTHIRNSVRTGRYGSNQLQANMRQAIRKRLEVEESQADNVSDAFTQDGEIYLEEEVFLPLSEIKGSYFGFLQGRWPIHLLASNELPWGVFKNDDVISCKVSSETPDRWSFVPINSREGDDNWFCLYFDLPDEIALMVKESFREPERVANLKREYFSFLDVTGKIEGIRRQVRLEIDEDWLSAYLATLGI